MAHSTVGERARSMVWSSAQNARRSPELVDSTPLVRNPEKLRERFRVDGYLFFRGLLGDRIERAAAQVKAALRGLGWIVAGTEATAGPQACSVGHGDFAPGLRAVLGQRGIHEVTHDRDLLAVAHGLFGEDVVTQPRTTPRIIFPASSNPNSETAAHQDFPYVQGSLDTVTLWLPLMDVSRSAGSLEVLRGSHLQGLRGMFGGTAYRCAATKVDPDSEDWRGADFHLGDVLLFSCLTVHRARPNLSRLLRLSIDCRIQPTNSRMAESSLTPAFLPGREAWSDLFADGMPYRLAPGTEVVPSVPPESVRSVSERSGRVFPWIVL